MPASHFSIQSSETVHLLYVSIRIVGLCRACVVKIGSSQVILTRAFVLTCFVYKVKRQQQHNKNNGVLYQCSSITLASAIENSFWSRLTIIFTVLRCLKDMLVIK